MADRRMITKTVMNREDVIDMSFAAQNLYMRLILEADDDGFLIGARNVMRSCAIPQEAFDELISNGYIIHFKSGVTVVCHWYQHNSVSPSKKKETIFKAEREELILLGEVYRLKKDVVGSISPAEEHPEENNGKGCIDNRQQIGNEPADNQQHKQEADASALGSGQTAQDKVGKVSIGQGKLEEGSTGQSNNPSYPPVLYASGSDEKATPNGRRDIRPQKAAPFNGKVWLTDAEAADLQKNYNAYDLRKNCEILLSDRHLMPIDHYAWLCERTPRLKSGI